MAKRLQVQVRSQIFDLLDPISFLTILSAFKLAYDTNWGQNGAAFWLSYVFMKRSTAAKLNTRIILKLKSHKRWKEVTVVPSCEVVKYLLTTYARDSIIALTKPSTM